MFRCANTRALRWQIFGKPLRYGLPCALFAVAEARRCWRANC
jgi:hypothetical protein